MQKYDDGIHVKGVFLLPRVLSTRVLHSRVCASTSSRVDRANPKMARLAIFGWARSTLPRLRGRWLCCRRWGGRGVKCGCMQLCCVGARPGVKSWRNMVQVAANTKTNLCPSSSCDFFLSWWFVCLFVCENVGSFFVVPGHGQNRNQDKIGTKSRRSQWRLPVKWPFTNDKIDMIYFFPEFVLGMSSIQHFDIFHLRYWSIRSEFINDLSNNLVILSANSSPTWDCNSQYCSIIPNSPYLRALIQSKIRMKIKILKSWDRNIHVTLREANCFSKYLYFSALIRSKYNRIRSHGEQGRSHFWKYPFPWSYWLDQKRVCKLSKNYRWNLQT